MDQAGLIVHEFATVWHKYNTVCVILYWSYAQPMPCMLARSYGGSRRRFGSNKKIGSESNHFSIRQRCGNRIPFDAEVIDYELSFEN